MIGALTDSAGNFHIIKVPIGNYDVVTRLVGFAPTRQSGVVVEAGRTTTVDVTIKKAPVRILGDPAVPQPPRPRPQPCAGRFDRKVGVAAYYHGSFYLALGDSTLAPGTRVTGIDAEHPQKTRSLKVVRRISGRKWPDVPQMGPHSGLNVSYLLETDGSPPGGQLLGFGLIEPATRPRKEKGRWVLDIDGDRRLEVLDYCTGTETLNLYVRSKVTGEECWHGEYYLGYDVEPTCPESWKGGK